MTTSRQPKGIPVGGQFAPEKHTEPEITLHGVPLANIEAAHKNARQLLQKEIEQLACEVAVSSAVAIAARTKAMFPTARFAVFHTGDDDYTSPEPYSVLDADRNELTVRWSHRDGASDWVYGEDDEDPASIHMLAFDMENHGGKLDGVLTGRLPGPGAHNQLELDLDKALEIS